MRAYRSQGPERIVASFMRETVGPKRKPPEARWLGGYEKTSASAYIVLSRSVCLLIICTVRIPKASVSIYLISSIPMDRQPYALDLHRLTADTESPGHLAPSRSRRSPISRSRYRVATCGASIPSFDAWYEDPRGRISLRSVERRGWWP